jgi:drug/metabolite transporter (DMT)-like permease
LRSPGINAVPAGVLLLLCLLWAGTSLRSDLLPGSISATDSSPSLHQASILALFAVIAAATTFARREKWPRGRPFLEALLVGSGLLALPALVIELAQGQVDDSTRVALFSLVPIFAVVLEPHLSSAMQLPRRGGLAAALAAVAGTLLIFPLQLPRAPDAALAFCGLIGAVASIAAANCIAVKCVQVLPALSISGFAAIATGSAAILIAIAGLSIKHRAWPAVHIDAWAIPDLCALALLFWLFQRMSAVRMTARFLIAPLVANLIALALLRPGVQARAWLGLTLIVLGSGWLLFAPENEPEKTGSPLGIW